MKIIMLSAGKGSRLMPLTRNTPKPLLDLNHGKTLLEEQLESIEKSKVIDEVVIVVGYLAEQIEAKIKLYIQKGLKITTIYNPFYDISNNLLSLWMAKNHMDEEFIITNGDNIFKEDVFRDLVQNNSDGIFLTINKKDKYDEDDMKVNLENDKLIQVSKTIPLEESNAESVGLVYVSGNRYTNVFRKAMERLVRNFEYRNKFWLEIFNKLSLNGVNIKTFEIDGETKWKELDFHPDIENVKKIIGI